jgi:dolichol-phosphate mannosyltransferase
MANDAVDLTIVIPCFNESDSVSKIKRELADAVPHLEAFGSIEVVFVDDGSDDQTAMKLNQEFSQGLAGARVSLVQHDRNRGLGAALRTGFAAARGNVIVTIDSDSTYRFSEIPALLERLRPEVDIVTASPYHPDGGVEGVGWFRLLLSRGSSLMYRALVDSRVHTYTALFRGYRREVVERVRFSADGFLGGTELLVKAIGRGYRVSEYPTVLHSRTIGVSKAKIVRTIRAHLEFQARVLLSRIGLASLDELPRHDSKRAEAE